MKKLLSILLFASIIMSTFVIGANAVSEEPLFADLDQNSWYNEPIAIAYNAGIVSGYDDGNFYPNEDLSLAELSLMLYRMAEHKGMDVTMESEEVNTILSNYRNCETDAWYSDAIAWLYSKDILFCIDGMPDSSLSLISNAQFATIFSRFSTYMGVEFEESPRIDSFSNEDEFPDWAVEHIEVLRKAGVIYSGNAAGEFLFDYIMSRAGVVNYINRVFDQFDIETPDELPDPIPRRPEDDKKLNDFEYSVNEDDSATITKYIGINTTVTIPDAIAGRTVTVIGENAFKDRTDIIEVDFHNSILEIDDHAFYGCTNLSINTLPWYIERIGAYAFAGCKSYSHPKLPITIKSIGANAFDLGKDGVAMISYVGDRDQWSRVAVEDSQYAKQLNEEIVIRKNHNTENDFQYTPNSDGTVTIIKYTGTTGYVTVPAVIGGKTVTKMDRDVFEGSENILKEVIISEGIITVNGFFKCNLLEKVEMPDSVKTIEAGAFQECSSLREIYLPEGLEGIGQNAFKSSGLESVTLPSSLKKQGYESFGSCNNLKSVTISEGIKTVSRAVFKDCNNLSEINLPSTVTTIEEYAFDEHAADSIVVPASVVKVERYGFYSVKNTKMFFEGNLPEFSVYENSLPDRFTYFYREGKSGWHKLPNFTMGNYRSYKFPSDTSYDSWYRDYVAYAIENGLMNGTSENTFEPESNMTRAMLVTVLWRLDGCPLENGDTQFTDLKDDWYLDAVSWAYANGIVKGTGETTFDPDGNITREQMAAILYRYSQYKGYAIEAKGDLSNFPDVDLVSGYAETAISWACGYGYITGSAEGGALYLDPLGNATRAQVATILTRYVKAN